MRLLYFILLFPFYLNAQVAAEQPKKGPSGSNYPHQKVKFTQFGDNRFNWYWQFEPSNPKPDSSEVIFFYHGHTSNTDSTEIVKGMKLFCEHIAKKGYTVIFPLYQYGNFSKGIPLQKDADLIKTAIKRLENDENRVRPKKWANGKYKISIMGFSLGGGTAINIANKHIELGLPKFDAIISFAPANKGSLKGISPDTKVVIVAGEDDETDGPKAETNAQPITWSRLSHIPCENRAFFMAMTDKHGNPPLKAKHDWCVTGDKFSEKYKINNLDFYGSWKWTVGLFDCTYKNKNCQFVFGDSKLRTYMGKWDDGTPVKEATIPVECVYTSTSNIKNNSITIHPNPVQETIHFDSKLMAKSIRIYSITGAQIPVTMHENYINVQHLNKGIYFGKIYGKGGTIYSFRFVKS